MQETNIPVARDLVLVGGGHAHVHVLKKFGMKPEPGTRLTLICKDTLTPYSGMIPGHLAGRYSVAEAHIDLVRLCRFAGARFYHSTAIGLDLTAKTVLTADRPPVAYDLLSIDTGSTPPVSEIQCANPEPKALIPIKPIDRFMADWRLREAEIRQHTEPVHMVVIGGGAGGAEVALALTYRMRDRPAFNVTIVDRAAVPLASHSRAVSTLMTKLLAARGIRFIGGDSVVRAESDGLVLESGRRIEAEIIVFATGAAPPPWLAHTGLTLSADGYIAVDPTLAAVGHEDIFAAGDVADFVSDPLPKSGVYAVRQGPVLADNLRRALRGRPLTPYRPQTKTLALISTGEAHALFSYGPLALSGGWAWILKDWIDRRWMRKYQELPRMAEAAGDDENSLFAMRCGGCGAKVASPILRRVLQRLQSDGPPAVFAGLDASDDAAVLTPLAGQQLVQSVDHFRAFIDDPFYFGEIAATHCMSDLYAMGAEVHSVQTMVTVPYADPAKVEATVYELMRGVGAALAEAGATLVGGHTAEGAELTLGLAVNGFAPASTLQRKRNLRPGDRLILTKALGTGVIFAADMTADCPGPVVTAALAEMRRSNRAAAAILKASNAHGLTDVTGFGLAGHLIEMLEASQCTATLKYDSLPHLPGALELLAAGHRSSLHPGNLAFQSRVEAANATDTPAYALLFDPQTSGGLLAGVPETDAATVLRELHAAGYGHASDIGFIAPGSGDIRLQ